jgi:Rap1a immunity proteins
MAAICLSYSNAIAETQTLKTIPNKKTEAQIPTTQANDGDKEISGKGVVEVGDIYIACKYYFSKIFTTRESIARKNICNGYFFGSASVLLLLQNEGVATNTCIPMDISTEEIIRNFIEWTDKNQDKMKLPAPEALLQIFRETYACDEYKPKKN